MFSKSFLVILVILNFTIAPSETFMLDKDFLRFNGFFLYRVVQQEAETSDCYRDELKALQSDCSDAALDRVSLWKKHGWGEFFVYWIFIF